MESLVGLLIIAGVIGLAYLIWWWNRSGALSFETDAPQEQIIQTCIKFCTADSYITTTQVGQSATFTRELGGGGCVGALLLLLLIIPGVVYLVVHKSRATLSVNIQSLKGSRNLVALHWNHWGTVQNITRALREALEART